MASRRDPKRRVLRNGESVRADGKYQFKYYMNGKIKFVYSWRLEPNDPVPAGKKAGPSLRELEKEIGRDFASMIDPSQKGMLVKELVERYLKTKTGVRPNTLSNYYFVRNRPCNRTFLRCRGSCSLDSCGQWTWKRKRTFKHDTRRMYEI